ncbi:uncharacterized protein LOC141679769 [Apium graveolens]|uniref:uncharacterized protein LOC141679769 n=1 Tax=Apium graveolens TaxID=4045 RepID=UPI003D79319B
MSLIAWKCRGLGRARTVHFLKETTQQLKPSFIFLSETLANKDRVDAVGRWRYTGFYGCPERSRRRESWGISLAAKSDLPWCIIGDFNDLMCIGEKRGGGDHPRYLLTGFADAVCEYGLTDLGFVGEKYTWEKSRGTSNWVQERLDRGLATQDWRNLFPLAEVQVLEVATSDHLPLHLQLNKKVYVPRGRCFKFENVWLKEKDCINLVQTSWNHSEGKEILEKIHYCCVKLDEWGGGVSQEYKRKLDSCRIQMRKLRTRRDFAGARMYNAVRWEYMNFLEKQEVYWKQRAKQFWLQEGDRNTKFFHRNTSVRKKQNSVQKIKDEDGIW